MSEKPGITEEPSTENIEKLTTELDIQYKPFPHPADSREAEINPVWRILFELSSEPGKQFGLDINDDVILGRGSSFLDLFDLTPFGASNESGVSRRHLMLRPTPNKLLAIDLGSTNGTLQNGRNMGFNTPYSVMNGDELMLGRLGLLVYIVDRPRSQTTWLAKELNLADAMAEIGQSITSQLELDEVFNQVAETAQSLTSAGETGIWLIDEQTGELVLEAERGIADEKVRLMRIPIDRGNPAGRVIESGKPLRLRREPYQDKIKVKTDYLVEALIYIPITLHRITFGVLSAVHREQGKQFSERDEHLLSAIAQFAAIAIQNARLYQATDEELARRVDELSALNYENARLFAEARRQKAAIETIAQVLDQPLLLLDEHGEILISNKAAQNVLDVHMPQLFDAISQGVGRTVEVEIGQETYVSTTEHVEDVGTIVVMQDISYVKELEQERDSFINALSHDLKSPLTSIIGWANLIEKFNPLNEQGKTYLERLLGAADTILLMINQLLQSVDIIETGKLVKGPCHLEEVVANAIKDMEGSALVKRTAVHFEQTGTPYPVLADQRRLYHLVLNLIDNAIKYSPEESQVKILLNFTSEAAVLQVEDQGAGIPEEDIGHIFERFYRGARSRELPGTGMGLSVAREAVEAHGGEITAVNKPEGGSTFTVVLPASLRVPDATLNNKSE